jgi:ferrochelatase
MNHSGLHKTGVLLVNLGSPASTKTRDVRRFLREFLGDPRVVNLPRPVWWLILNLFVLPFRPRKSAHAYQSIWTEQGSPLIVFTRQLSEKLATRLAVDGIVVDCAMRYGKPALVEKLHEFKQQGVDDIVIVPLYPQYSSTTTASIFDVVAEVFIGWRHMPSLRFISDFHHNSAYIQAVANSVRAYWQQHGQAELLMMSFHGLPAKLTQLGDPYFHQCHATGKLIAENLGLQDGQWQLVFQSRFGKAEWLKPYCVEVLAQLPEQGIKQVDVICPGFSVDCLETLEEIAIANQEIFMEAGGERYRYIPALNDSDAHVEVMIDLISTAR